MLVLVPICFTLDFLTFFCFFYTVEISVNLYICFFAASEFEKESPMKCIEPQSLACLHKRSREINKAEEIDHSALEMTLEVTIKHKQQTAPAERGNITIYYKEKY